MTNLIIALMFMACNNGFTNSIGGHKSETQRLTIDNTEGNFKDFIDKFSTDSTFQISRTKFPLKTIWYDLDNFRDSILYLDESKFEIMDFRNKKSTGQHDQWEQKIIIGKDNDSATIEVRGVDNGIVVDYLFKKINGVWMLIQLNDRST